VTKLWGSAGPRAIHPEMCFSQSLGRCGLLANVLYVRLLIQADDQGRLLADLRDVKARCLPFMAEEPSLADIETALGALEAEGWLQRYSAGAHADLLQILNWWSSQHGARRAYPSDLPAPEGWQDHAFGYPGGPNKPDFAVILASQNNSPQVAAKRREVREGAALSDKARGDAALPVPNPIPNPDATADGKNGAAPWAARPFPRFEEVMRKRNDPDSGSRP
jgi:hypothetical protein